MRNKFVSLQALALLVIFCLTGSLTRAAVNPKPFVVPELKQWTGKDGNFTPGKDARIVCTSQNPELLRIARMFADDYQQMFGQTLSVAQGKATSGDFVLSLSADKKLGEEGYAIKITDRVAISAPTPTGLYWSTRTLLQLAEQNQERSLPQGTIRDYPDYPLRGFMIDCGRKFIPMAYLQDLVKIMAYYKMNTLQVHLNDNGFKQYFEHNWDKTYAAFRLESETYPGLTARDGSYSKKEFIDFQKQAASNFVEIIPEIDVPAHSLALTHYKPEIGSKEYGMGSSRLVQAGNLRIRRCSVQRISGRRQSGIRRQACTYRYRRILEREERRGRKIPCFHRPLHPFCGRFRQASSRMGRAQPCQRRYARQIRKCRHECLVQRIRRSGNYDQRRISTDQYSGRTGIYRSESRLLL